MIGTLEYIDVGRLHALVIGELIILMIGILEYIDIGGLHSLVVGELIILISGVLEHINFFISVQINPSQLFVCTQN
jgi:hypothetical protein